MGRSLVLFQLHTELGLICCHPNFVLLLKLGALDDSSAKSEHLTDTVTCPVKLMNASKFPLTDIETVLFS